MQIFLGLGSNAGDRGSNLRVAIRRLQQQGFQIERVSPVVETPAGVSAADPDDWNRPYLNLVLQGTDDRGPDALLECTKLIEREINETGAPPLAPCSIRIHLLLHGRTRHCSPELVLPYPGLVNRPYLLGPMVAIASHLVIPGLGPRTVLDWARELPHQPPLWMGIVNVTPDSFSDGGAYSSTEKVMGQVESLVDAGAQIIDLGAESTRPGACPLSPSEEWSRLEPVLPLLLDQYARDPVGRQWPVMPREDMRNTSLGRDGRTG